MTKYFAALLTFFVAWPSIAADLNGYTAQYECRAGGPKCNVDVVTLTNTACDTTITTADSMSTITSKMANNRFICVQNGNYVSKGRWDLPNSGTAGARKVLRYTRIGDSDDEPWNQSEENRAILHSIYTLGKNYWIIHRITIDRNETTPGGGITAGILLGDGFNNIKSENHIVNRVLIQEINGTGVVTGAGSAYNVVQNSVIRKMVPYPQSTGTELMCVELGRSVNTYIVNNELYDCDKGVSAGDGSFTEGDIIENNDIYLSLAGRTDCNGNYTPNGECSGYMESGISLKSSGSQGNPTQIVHNRIWGCRWADGNVTQGGDCPLISISANSQGGSADYTIVKNNILFDAELGIWNYHGTGTAPANPDHVSIIGNLIYDIRNHRPSNPQELAGALMYRDVDNSEYYLNTVINATYWLVTRGYGTNNDIRCNIAINSSGQTGDIGSGTQVDNNAFYATPAFSTNNQGINISKPNASDSANVEYCFNRKLRTGPEKFCIPNARSTTASPHYQACSNTLGTRTGIGIDDLQLF